MIFIRTNSHRARDRVQSALGRKPQSFFSFYDNGSYQQIEPTEYDRIKHIPGVTRARLKRPDKIMECWDWH